MEIASFILALAKAIPAFDRIYQRSVVLYYEQQETQDQNHTEENRLKRDALIDALNQPGLKDETRRNLTRQLVALNRV